MFSDSRRRLCAFGDARPKNFAELGAREEDFSQLVSTLLHGSNGSISGFATPNEEDCKTSINWWCEKCYNAGLDMPLLDNRQGRDLTGTLIADIVLQLLFCVAQTEREFIKHRQAEGIAAAKKGGVRFGARPIDRPNGYEACYTAWKSGKLSARAAAERLNVSQPTFLKWAHAQNKQ